MPAAGSQNSANLADTIDSIPAGGGNAFELYTAAALDDFNKAEFEAAVADLDTYVIDSYEDTYSTKAAQEAAFNLTSHGWVANSLNTQSLSSMKFITLGFADYVDSIKIHKTFFWYYKVPSSVTLNTEEDSNGRLEFTFGGTERVIQLAIGSGYNLNNWWNGDNVRSSEAAKAIWSSAYQTMARGYALKQFTSTADVSANLNGYMFSDLAVGTIERFGRVFKIPKNMKLGLNYLLYSDYSQGTLVSNPQTFKKGVTILLYFTNGGDITEYSSDTKVNSYIQFDNAVLSLVPKLVGSSAYSEYTSLTDMYSRYGLTKVPFILDLSQDTGTGTFKLFKDNSAIIPSPITDLRLILPSTYSTVDLTCKTGNANATSVPLNLESWQYIATNAPTVSSKTLTVGLPTKSKMIYDSDWAAVKSTLESKGWTI